MMYEQLTLCFDEIPADVFGNVKIEEVASWIESKFNIHFERGDNRDYRFTRGKKELSLQKCQFSPTIHNGVHFISVRYDNKKDLSGSGCPCSTWKEVFKEVSRIISMM